MSRMQQVVTGRQARPLRVVLYGPPGIGKSTFGADAPGAIFLPIEDGTEELEVMRFPQPETWDEALEAVALLSRGVPEFAKVGSLVIDTLDALEVLIHRAVCAEAQVKSIEEVGGGYGKGYTRALDYWRQFLQRLEALQVKRGMHVVMLAHAEWEKLTNPHGADYHRLSMKLNNKARALVREWSRDVLLADWQVSVAEKKGFEKKKASTTRKRLLFTQFASTFDVKTRGDLPATMPLSFQAFWTARTRTPAQRAADPALVNEVRAVLGALPAHMRVTEKGIDLVDLAVKAGGAAVRKLLNWAIVQRDEIDGDDTPADAPSAGQAAPANVPGAENVPQAEVDEDDADVGSNEPAPFTGNDEDGAEDESPVDGEESEDDGDANEDAPPTQAAPKPSPAPQKPAPVSSAAQGGAPVKSPAASASASGSTAPGAGSAVKKPAKKVTVKA
jgi:hypothetical protein